MTDTVDELRIIANDARCMDNTDRAIIERAADELESVCRSLVSSQYALIESQQRQMATNERLQEVSRMHLMQKPLYRVILRDLTG